MFRFLFRVIFFCWRFWRHRIPRLAPGELPTRRHTDAFYAHPRWARLSYRTKCRYGWVCLRCRRRPPGVVIVADHIKPLRYFWELRFDPENLQVLCVSCNLAKGSHDQTDYRPKRRGRWWRPVLDWVFGMPGSKLYVEPPGQSVRRPTPRLP